MFRTIFYGGSYYDGLRVGNANEYDLDLLMTIPKSAKPVLTISNIPGFVQVQLKAFDTFMKQPEAKAYTKFQDLFDKDYRLNTKKVLSWMEGLFTEVLNDYRSNLGKLPILHYEGVAYEVGIISP